jgi:type I restriction enzyme R subunit
MSDRKEMYRGAALGVAGGSSAARREADYLLFVDRKAAGVIEAKPEGVTLTGVAAQAEEYMVPLSSQVQQ